MFKNKICVKINLKKLVFLSNWMLFFLTFCDFLPFSYLPLGIN